jgi:hypothetical protein
MSDFDFLLLTLSLASSWSAPWWRRSPSMCTGASGIMSADGDGHHLAIERAR